MASYLPAITTEIKVNKTVIYRKFLFFLSQLQIIEKYLMSLIV